MHVRWVGSKKVQGWSACVKTAIETIRLSAFMLFCNFADNFLLFSHIHRQKTCTQSSQHQETSNQQVKGEKVLDSFQSLTFSDWVLQWQAGQHFTSMVTGWLLWISVILGDNSSLWCWRIRLWAKEKERGREKCLQVRERESFWFRLGTEGNAVRLCPLLVRKGNIKGKTGVMRE